jgi:ribosomal protein L24
MKRIKRHDLVKIISGGQKGKIAKVMRLDGQKVYLENIGQRQRHMKANRLSGGQGAKKDIQLSIDISNLALVVDDTKGSEKISRVAYRLKDDGSKVRLAKQNARKEIKS